MSTTQPATAESAPPAPLRERARGALLGLAAGDAIGFPALYHRMIPLPWQRALLWTQASELSAQQINKVPLPFTLGPPDPLFLSGTDDTEFAVVAARILLEAGDLPTSEALFDGWLRHVVDAADQVWSGVAERASIDNAHKGLQPPATGNDNPHHFDDGAVTRAVPVGIRYAGRPADAAAVASRLAAITNAEDGVAAARAMAVSVSLLVAGGTADEAIRAGIAEVPEDTWLGRNLQKTFAILDEAGSGFAALPRWSHEIANGSYNFGNIAAETLPIAYAIVRSTGSLSEALGLAAMIPKQADSMPAMVGALAGARFGVSALPQQWQSTLDRVRGICVPTTSGVSLCELADALSG